MKFYHISHTDLDGYACQLLTKEFFKTGFYINANYGSEVKQSIEAVLQEIKKNLDSEILFLITDLNLTVGESKDLNKEITALNEAGANIKLQLLDHHATGQKSANMYEWYLLDTTRCATKIVYDYLFDEYEGFNCQENAWIKPLVDAINAVDIWLDHEVENFEFGKVLMRLVSRASEINNILFADENRAFRISLLKSAAAYIKEKDGHIKLDDEIHFLKKEYLKCNGSNDTIDNLSAKYLVHSLENRKEDLTITYRGHKGLLTYTLGSISIPANAFLKANDEYDFFIDISRRGNVSLRADGKIDVGILAEKLAKGGGHPNASGAKFMDFVETINYDDVKNFIQERLKRCE
ncbi:MAG: DHH family phosphoesterase [Candidatus Marinarcus sp.]|uniref:DHH family phosphoesterase n=1 Tax=Candidatus Marinarcus sp. TaxID=3100987 RepID=UPI003AFFF522